MDILQNEKKEENFFSDMTDRYIKKAPENIFSEMTDRYIKKAPSVLP